MSALPSRLDRLIAFLDSYFGHVELIEPQSTSTPASADVAMTDAPVVVDSNESPEKAEMELAAKADEAALAKKEEVEVKLEHPRVPVIRVRLDDHVADVTVENLVSLAFRCAVLGSSADHPPPQSVTSDHEPLQRRVESVIQLAMSIVLPLSASAAGGDRSLLEEHRSKRPELESLSEERAEDV